MKSGVFRQVCLLVHSDLHWVLLFVWFFSASASATPCFDHAAQRYGVPSQLLKAIAIQESSGRPNAINRNPNGSFDLGLMQINSGWLPTLKRYGISEQHLFDPCVSILVGAWILSNNFSRLGYNTQGLGAYNAASPHKREIYARQVLRRLDQVHRMQSHGLASAHGRTNGR